MLTILLTLTLWQMPAGMSHDEHHKQMTRDEATKARGAAAMGFDQDATVHHFRLAPDGGSIEVSVRRADDEANREAIRSHLQTIARQFGDGDFSKPLLTHAENPPGAERMKARRAEIAYSYEETPGGGLVRIRSTSSGAIDAVHDFVRYQITEHHTGDPLHIPGGGL